MNKFYTNVISAAVVFVLTYVVFLPGIVQERYTMNLFLAMVIGLVSVPSIIIGLFYIACTSESAPIFIKRMIGEVE